MHNGAFVLLFEFADPNWSFSVGEVFSQPAPTLYSPKSCGVGIGDQAFRGKMATLDYCRSVKSERYLHLNHATPSPSPLGVLFSTYFRHSFDITALFHMNMFHHSATRRPHGILTRHSKFGSAWTRELHPWLALPILPTHRVACISTMSMEAKWSTLPTT